MPQNPLRTALLALLLASPAPQVWGGPSDQASSAALGADSLLPDASPAPVPIDSTAAAPASPARGLPAAVERGEPGLLARHLALRLQPTRLSAPVEPGRRYGYGSLALALPLGSAMELRGGLRLDYDNRPSEGAWELKGRPSLEFALEF